MRFKQSLFDGTDPLYAPGISFSRQYAFWKPPAKYVRAGFRKDKIKIDPPGSRHDEHAATRAARCRELTRDMLQWYESLDVPKRDPRTWDYMIMRYQTDAFSPMQDVKGNTKEGYKSQIQRLQPVIGHMKVGDMTYEQIKRIEQAMKQKGHSLYSINLFFSTMRRIARYGTALALPDAAQVSAVLAECRFPKGAKRQVFPTREQIMAIVDAADKDGSHDFATGILLQFELTLRAVDVRGQWLKDTGEGGIRRNGRIWQDGLEWSMFAPDLSSFAKVISKTRKSYPDAMTFDLADLPDLRDRLRTMAQRAGKVGPVVRTKRDPSMPYTKEGWTIAWRRYREAAGVPKEIKMMDTRAGAITEAKQLGANPFDIRDAAQHSNVETTDGYARGRASSKVVKLRQNR